MFGGQICHVQMKIDRMGLQLQTCTKIPGVTIFAPFTLTLEVFSASVTTDYDCSIKVAKSTLLQQLVYGGDFDVIGVCETWLKSTIVDGEILPSLSKR